MFGSSCLCSFQLVFCTYGGSNGRRIHTTGLSLCSHHPHIFTTRCWLLRNMLEYVTIWIVSFTFVSDAQIVPNPHRKHTTAVVLSLKGWNQRDRKIHKKWTICSWMWLMELALWDRSNSICSWLFRTVQDNRYRITACISSWIFTRNMSQALL